jgi:hypothetical protein
VLDSEDLAYKAQQAAEARMRDVTDRFWAEEEGDDEAWAGFDAIAPYCGCDTCLVREVLYGAWPHLLEAARLEARIELSIT